MAELVLFLWPPHSHPKPQIPKSPLRSSRENEEGEWKRWENLSFQVGQTQLKTLNTSTFSQMASNNCHKNYVTFNLYFGGFLLSVSHYSVRKMNATRLLSLVCWFLVPSILYPILAPRPALVWSPSFWASNRGNKLPPNDC